MSLKLGNIAIQAQLKTKARRRVGQGLWGPFKLNKDIWSFVDIVATAERIRGEGTSVPRLSPH